LTGAQFVPADVARSNRTSETPRAQLGAARFEAAHAEGWSAGLERIVRYAMDTAAEQVESPLGSPPPPPR